MRIGCDPRRERSEARASYAKRVGSTPWRASAAVEHEFEQRLELPYLRFYGEVLDDALTPPDTELVPANGIGDQLLDGTYQRRR